MPEQRPIFVDETHCGGRHVTGLERITLELFSEQALAPLKLTPIRAASQVALIARQNALLPWKAAMAPGALVLTPGFPPAILLSLFGARVIPYVHDLFLITRWRDLPAKAKLYMAAPFRFALARLPRFLVNSESTARELRGFCRSDAEIILYRPDIRNVFGVMPATSSDDRPVAPRLIALGTVEPRKNLLAAASIVATLRATTHPSAQLDIVGRTGWGPDGEALAAAPGVTLHGYQPLERVRELLGAADALISTSHDEGLGLPLLEAQYAGLPVIAPDKPVFREVLGRSGTFIDASDTASSAERIAALFSGPAWRSTGRDAALANLERWNSVAKADRARVVALLAKLAGENAGP